MDEKNILWIVYLIAYSCILDEEIIVQKNDEHTLALTEIQGLNEMKVQVSSCEKESASIILCKLE